MDQLLIKLIKRENKKINRIRLKLGWCAFTIFATSYITGMGLIVQTPPEFPYYWLCVCMGFLLLLFSVTFLHYSSKKINKRVNIKLKTDTEKNYTKRVIKEYLISGGYYHHELIKHLITTFESRYKDKINAAIIISLVIFVISPAWGLILNIAYSKDNNMSVIFILTSLMIGIVFFIYLLIKILTSYKYYLDSYIVTQLKEISTECLFEEINKRKVN
ncbi:TPA: hypothetical protein NR472_002656 [Listeria innocua]|uniref:hypothetical protein n=1 Tax=Listeria TaxID=1637 RepID=UPI001629D3C6|nr:MULTISPECIES: hypothetical protein [Listeria]EAE9448803.1 hypothetical protein [Listeria monocytogenes]MBC1460394.1 hypothetical protein [Listeria welshimeri]MBC1612895.1 hypothetical protein [Listeria welshimeri]MBF2378479.1 hypothetical protein [Listeria welshimeri]MBF2633229.1 hypothetical protein [Listeria innocua]